MWHKADVDSVHDERIGSSGDQLVKNVTYGDGGYGSSEHEYDIC